MVNPIVFPSDSDKICVTLLTKEIEISLSLLHRNLHANVGNISIFNFGKIFERLYQQRIALKQYIKELKHDATLANW